MAYDSQIVLLLNELFSTTDSKRRAALKAVIGVVGSEEVPRSQWLEKSLAALEKRDAAIEEHVREICRRLGVQE